MAFATYFQFGTFYSSNKVYSSRLLSMQDCSLGVIGGAIGESSGLTSDDVKAFSHLTSAFQWQIQDFPRGGANSQSGCTILFIC